MKILKLLTAAFGAAFFFASAALAQNPGTVTNHAFVIGKGAGQTGFTSLLCGTAQLAVGQAAADPVCQTVTGDVTISAAGVTAIGATKVTSAMLNADVYSTAHTWSGQQTFVAPILGTPASGTLTNATGLPIATGVSGLGTGIAAALGVNVGTAGSPVLNGGALGTPSSGTLTNASGLPVGGIASVAANTILGNFTGSSASPTATDISSLTTKASPAAGDYVLLSDQAASGALKKATASSLAAAGAVATFNGQTGAVVGYFPPQGRLTLTSGTPVMSASVTAATTVYYALYGGNLVPVYDGTNVVPTAISQLSVALGANWSANSNYDWFIGSDAGTIRLCSGPAWSSDTSRGTGAGTTEISRTIGYFFNTNSMTCRYGNASTFTCSANRCLYVGSMRTGSAGQTNYIFGASSAGGTAALLGLWNAYNRVDVRTTVNDSSASWSGTSSATPRSMNNSTGNRVSFIMGLNEEGISSSVGVRVTHTTGFSQMGMGLDVTNAFDRASLTALPGGATSYATSLSVQHNYNPMLGFHFIQALEAGDGTNTPTYGGTTTQWLAVGLRM